MAVSKQRLIGRRCSPSTTGGGIDRIARRRPVCARGSRFILLLSGRPSQRRLTQQSSILVVEEQWVGSSALAQPYLDRFVAIAAGDGWADAKDDADDRSPAEAFIQAHQPHYGVFLAARFPGPARRSRSLRLIGQWRCRWPRTTSTT